MKSPGIRFIEKDNSFITVGAPAQTTMAFIGRFDKGPAFTPLLVNQHQLRQVFNTAITSQNPDTSFTYISASKYLQVVNQGLIIRVLGNNCSNGEVSVAGYNDDSVPSAEDDSPPDEVFFKINTIGDGTYVNWSGTTGYQIKITNVIQNAAATQVGTLFDVEVYYNGVMVQAFRECGLIESQSNFIAKKIGDQYSTFDAMQNQVAQHGVYSNKSRHIYVQIDGTGIDFPYDNPNAVLWEGTYDVSGGSDGDEITYYNYEQAVKILNNQDLYDIQAIVIPQLNAADASEDSGDIPTSPKDVYVTALQVCEDRSGDCMVIANAGDLGDPYNDVDILNLSNTYNSSYIAFYFNWVRTRYDNVNIYVPPVTFIPKIYGFNDLIKFKWFAAAGHSRGRIEQAISVQYKLNKNKRDQLYSNNINPIAYIANDGIMVYGQRTSQIKRSAVSGINVRRLCIYIIKRFTYHFRRVLFENNTSQTRTQLYNELKKLMQAIKDNEGVYAYQIVLDETLNTPDVIDQNYLVGELYIQPARTIQFIKFTINIQPSSATIEQTV